MLQFLVALGAALVLALTFVRPGLCLWLWVLVLETSLDSWGMALLGREEMIALVKGFGIMLALALACRYGARWDKFNPALGFGAVFLAGLVHGLYPGLGLSESLRSLIGSVAPFLFGFVCLPPAIIRAARHALLAGPLACIGLGALLVPLGLSSFCAWQDGALRLGGSGEPPFLAAFALTALYVTLDLHLAAPRPRWVALALLYLLIIALTGARVPLALGFAACGYVLLMRGRVMEIAAAGAAGALALIAATPLSFVRAIALTRLGEATDLSNRNLIWPDFTAAFARSPWLGWGLGAGKLVVPLDAPLSRLLGTNAAHNEYLRLAVEAGLLGSGLLLTLFILWAWHGTRALSPPRRGFIRLVFLLFALHSATDNALIATTSSALFLWLACIFAEAGNGTRGAPP